MKLKGKLPPAKKQASSPCPYWQQVQLSLHTRTDTLARTPCQRGLCEEHGGCIFGAGTDWSETYKARAAENLASAQYLLLRRLVRVLVVGEVEAWRAAGILALLQRRRVPFVHALQGATAHPPVEVVHALPLQDKQQLEQKRPWCLLQNNYKRCHKRSKQLYIPQLQKAEQGREVILFYFFRGMTDGMI